MSSPPHALAKSVESSFDGMDARSSPHRSCASDTVVESYSPFHLQNQAQSRNPNKYMESMVFEQLVTPPGTSKLRVQVPSQSKNTGKRLDPLAVEMIETILAKKNIDILRQPLFPFTYTTEPIRQMEIRTHLLRRFSTSSQKSTPTTLRATIHRLLVLWGAKLVKVSDFQSRALRPSFHEVASSNDLLRLVSPLKRKKNKSTGEALGKENELQDLSPFVVRTSWTGTEADLLGRRKRLLGPSVAVTASKRSRFSSVQCFAKAAATLTVKDAANFERSPSTGATRKIDPSKKVPSKSVLFGKHDSQKRNPSTFHTKNTFSPRSQVVQRLVRRWTKGERDLFLRGLELHGFGAIDAIFRMIPGK